MRDSRGEGERWLRQAENDLALAQPALRERFFAQACFLAQQISEKALKAIAYANGERAAGPRGARGRRSLRGGGAGRALRERVGRSRYAGGVN